jgi:hypothetical protein
MNGHQLSSPKTSRNAFELIKDPIAQEALNEGCRLMGTERKFDQAMALFDQVVSRCPSYAEVISSKM